MDGTTTKLVPDRSREETDFTFEHYYKELKLLLFRVQWYEGNNYALIDITNGKKTYILGKSYFSPDNQFAIAINCDLEAQYSGNGFQLFELNGRNLKKIWEYKPTTWGPTDIKWIDKSTLISKNTHLDTNDYTTKRAYTKINVKRNAP